jgi:hypothetical protein
VLEALVQRLCAEKGFIPASQASLPDDARPPQIEFLGIRPYWGSVMSIGILHADHRSEHDWVAVTDELYRFTSALRPLAGSVNGARLGSFGLLALLFSEGCSPQQAASVRSLRRGSAWRKDYLVSWACDLPAGRVHAHRGFPLVMYPGRRYLEMVIRGVAP